jgi:hypothetical protein
MTEPLLSMTNSRQYRSSGDVAPPQASIIVVNYNGGQALMDCLASLHRDGASAEYEVILVDNASGDDSATLVADNFPEVRLIASENNLGFGGANNLGAQYALGEYLAFLNPDTVVEPGWLDALIASLETNPDAGLATSKILLLHDPGRINTAGNDLHLTGLALCRGMGQPATELNELSEVGAVSGAAFVIRRNLFTILGGFDPRFFMYFEDTDLSLRARLAGYRCLYVPESIIYHDYELRFGPLKTYYEERNRHLTLLKVFRWRTLLLLLPALLLAEIVTWGYVILLDRPRWGNKPRAYAHVLQGWSTLMATRRQVQSARRVRDRELLALTSHRLAFEQTGNGFVARAAHLFFDPLFFLHSKVLGRILPW